MACKQKANNARARTAKVFKLKLEAMGSNGERKPRFVGYRNRRLLLSSNCALLLCEEGAGED